MIARRAGLAWGAALLALAAAAPAVSAPVLKLQDPRTGKTVRLTPGAPALHLALFATWCHPCRDELDALAALEERWRERGYRLVLIAVPSRQDRERLVRFLQDRSPPGELLFDVDGETGTVLGAGQIPTHIILDASGKEVLRVERVADGVDEALETLLLGDRR